MWKRIVQSQHPNSAVLHAANLEVHHTQLAVPVLYLKIFFKAPGTVGCPGKNLESVFNIREAVGFPYSTSQKRP